MPDLTGPSLGKGFAMLAQAVVQVAQQIRIGNQLTALQMRATDMGASATQNADFRHIEADLFGKTLDPFTRTTPLEGGADRD